METSAIRYRVADFLKKQPPFQGMAEEDLLELAEQGRVRFYETNQYILSQGGSRHQIHVIQQGTVSLWKEESADSRLLDIRGAGDMIGVDQLQESRGYPYTATSETDVLLYSFPTEAFQYLIEKYPEASDYVSAYGDLSAAGRLSRENPAPENVSLRELVAGHKPLTCDPQTTIRDAARYLRSSGQDAIVVQNSDQALRGVLTARSLLEWIINGSGNAQQTVATLLKQPPTTIAPEASVAEAVLTMETSRADALAVTADGTGGGAVQAILTPRTLGQAFGDRPLEILQEIPQAANTRVLRELNQRARKLALRYLSAASSTDWLTRFTSLADIGIVKRIIEMTLREPMEGCWCFLGTSGRGEALPRLAPEVVFITNDDRAPAVFNRVQECIDECGYLRAAGGSFEHGFYAAPLDVWKERYLGWVNDPINNKIHLAGPFFDLRPVSGSEAIFTEIEKAVMKAINTRFLFLVANDCLSTLPPLTFFQNAVLDEAGAETQIFKLEETALRPLVDVGRVFGLATGKVFGSSTLERFSMAQDSLPEQAAIFREAAEALRIVLWQQGRVGISQGTAGNELPPALLAGYDRQLLKSAFRSILRLIEFTGDLKWLKTQ